MSPRTCILVLSAIAFACSDDAHEERDPSAADSSDDGGTEVPPADVDGVGISGLRRLTVHEYDATVRDVLGDDTQPGASSLPEDRRTPFDNDFAVQTASRVLVEGAETLARDISARAVADTARRELIVGCDTNDD